MNLNYLSKWIRVCSRLAIVVASTAAAITSHCVSQRLSAEQPLADARDGHWDFNIDPSKVLGAESCEKCHAAEVTTWRQTPHHETFLTLHRKKEAQEIAKKLGIVSFKSDANCVQCHYTMKESAPAGILTSVNAHRGPSDALHNVEAISGISCESCHGAAKDWIAIHNDYGGSGAAKANESSAHRRERMSKSIDAGMRNPVNAYLVAQSCYRCHTVPDEKLVNVGGHAPGSLDFEFVSWSQGTIRHNFLRTDGRFNAESSPEKLRVMFVAGMIADLEFSLRATANATQKNTFGITSAKRASRAAERIKSLRLKLEDDSKSSRILDEIVQVYSSVTLKLNQHDRLIEAAEQINQQGLAFAATVSGKELEAVEKYIPGHDRWK